MGVKNAWLTFWVLYFDIYIINCISSLLCIVFHNKLTVVSTLKAYVIFNKQLPSNITYCMRLFLGVCYCSPPPDDVLLQQLLDDVADVWHVDFVDETVDGLL